MILQADREEVWGLLFRVRDTETQKRPFFSHDTAQMYILAVTTLCLSSQEELAFHVNRLSSFIFSEK